MAVTVDEKLHNVERHLEKVSDACKGLDATSDHIRNLLYAVGYLHDAVRQIAEALKPDYEEVR